MDLTAILKNLENCPCGKKHTFYTERVEISSGATKKTGAILSEVNFPKNVLLVADEKTWGVADAEGLSASLAECGFTVKKLIYSSMMYARIEQVVELKALAADVDGIISVGTGSLNDICRVTSHEMGKKFCIFATAPSMDGFASDTAPIIENNFKTSWFVEQPYVIIADTKILAESPAELKAAGYGDMVAKYMGLADWRIANVLTGEYYCENIAKVTEDALAKMVALTDRVQSNDEEAAGAIMEALVLSGLAMKLAGCSRPASGSEHVVSHYWECYKLARGIWPEFHGKKVGVASLIINDLYRNLADKLPEVKATADPTDWEDVYSKFSPDQLPEVKKLNTPTITDKVDPKKLEECWGEIRKIIYESLPETEKLRELMKRAGCVTEIEDINVSQELFETGIRYHSYMRYRILLTRLLPMIGVDPIDYIG
ncbi:MAG: sn-glycerol-1-phosphate dehydrogenase [Clostridia bacterium]|nr:sn-glycerol-1-phosphate dehydrogenase [Clostridia bacterium]